jgi:hypothetical protein
LRVRFEVLGSRVGVLDGFHDLAQEVPTMRADAPTLQDTRATGGAIRGDARRKTVAGRQQGPRNTADKEAGGDRDDPVECGKRRVEPVDRASEDGDGEQYDRDRRSADHCREKLHDDSWGHEFSASWQRLTHGESARHVPRNFIQMERRDAASG